MRGPFWEPGPFASYLCFSLLLELFIAKEKDSKYLALLVSSLTLTFSTTGYLTASLILGAYVFSDNEKKNNKWMKIGVCILIASMISLIFLSDKVNNTLFGKFYEENESLKGRTNCFWANLMIIKEHPIFGVGVTKGASMLESYMRSMGSIRSFSNLNTVLSNFTIFGLACGLYFVIKLIGFCIHFINGWLPRILILLTSLVVFFTVIFFLKKESVQNELNIKKN